MNLSRQGWARQSSLVFWNCCWLSQIQRRQISSSLPSPLLVHFAKPNPLSQIDIYRPQGKVMFYTCLSVHRGVSTLPPHGQRLPLSGQRPEVLTSSGSHCSSQYVSYWNAFLLMLCNGFENTWLRMIYCLQIIWWENRKFQWRLWSVTILYREDMVQAGYD